MSSSKKYHNEYFQKVLNYRKELQNSLPSEYRIDITKFQDIVPIQVPYEVLTKEDIEITESNIMEIVSSIKEKKWTAVQVFHAFARRSVIAHQLTNCCMQFFIDEGFDRAKELDLYLKDTGKLVGPLHGVPISLKEFIEYKGKVTTGSYVGNLDYIPEKSGVTIDILYNLGAVFYARTSQPQAIMHLDTDNNLIGRTKNPLNPKLSPGGSSGGESALVAMGGSAVGVGSDIGGSIRVPAAFTGIWGIKPTSKRISMIGGVSGGAGQESIPAVEGPMARNAEDIDYFMNHYINDGEPWKYDANIIPLPWRQYPVPEAEKLSIGIMFDDGIVAPHPPILRGLNHVKNVLENANVTVVEFKPHKTLLALQTTLALYTCDGNKRQKTIFGKSEEPLLPLTEHFMNFNQGMELDIIANRDLNTVRDTLRNEYLNEFNKAGIDFLMSPNNVATAGIPGQTYYWGYSSLWNLLDYPSVTFPSGLFQDPSVDVASPSYKLFVNEFQKKELSYNANDYGGTSIAVQLTGRRFEDEKVLAASKFIHNLLNK